MDISADQVVDFWFSDRVQAHWFSSTETLDAEIKERYEGLWERAASGGLDHWMNEPVGALALAIVLDQFPLNMFRGQPKGFATEKKAIEVARHAVGNRFDEQLQGHRLSFLFMPFMHSEDLADQDISVALYRTYISRPWLNDSRIIIDIFLRFHTSIFTCEIIR
jgi:uncharacterized protein (DUF924 family)